MTASARGDQLVEQILSVPDASRELANELLVEFNRGYPVSSLAPLLSHQDERVIEAGVWLASELPGRLGELAEPAGSLVTHDRPEVRFFAIDVVLDNIADSGELLASALGLIRDVHEGVRWKAMRFASLADESQLRAAAGFLSKHDQAALRESGLLARDDGPSVEERVKADLTATEEVLRRWSAAAAARLGSEMLLEVASQSDDQDVSTFASRELSRLRRFGPARRQRSQS